jgi:hypothetical protein
MTKPNGRFSTLFRPGPILMLGMAMAFQHAALADSIDYISTSASIFAGAYNNNYDYLTGLQQHVTPNDANASISSSSVPGTNIPNLFFASQTLSGTVLDPHTGNPSVASSSAFVNLAAGTLGMSDSGSQGVGGGSDARMLDSVTFLNNTGHSAPVDVFWTVNGTFSVGTAGRADLNSTFCIGPGNPGLPACSNEIQYAFSAGLKTEQFIAGWNSSSLTPGNNEGFEVFHGVITIPNGQSTDGLYADLNMLCGGGIGGSSCDYTHTGSLSFGLPTGVSFSSASGVLLTQTAATVPEPASVVLLGLSLCAIGIGRFRRR